MLYNYGTSLIEGKLGCKWYISMVTGWHCRSPSFGEYFEGWMRQYVSSPAYHEKLQYVSKYYTTKDKYYTEPKLKYFDKYKTLYQQGWQKLTSELLTKECKTEKDREIVKQYILEKINAGLVYKGSSFKIKNIEI